MLIKNQPKTFIIALKGHPISEAQLCDCIESAKKFNWNIEISWGVDGRNINETHWKNIEVVPLLNKPTMSQIGTQGCFFSHWELWNKCIELNEPIIILEHDAIIQDYWPPLNADSIIKLHAHYKSKKVRIDEDTGSWTTSGHAYCLSPSHATTLINFSKRVGGIPVDILMGDKVVPVKHLGVPELVARQNLFSTTTTI
jgi:GR25 family glycosyltransferase involved in LPS biosynthesis